jgi:hypothetical protein
LSLFQRGHLAAGLDGLALSTKSRRRKALAALAALSSSAGAPLCMGVAPQLSGAHGVLK